MADFSWYDKNKVPGTTNNSQGLTSILNPLSGGTMQNGAMGQLQTGSTMSTMDHGDGSESFSTPTYSEGYTPGSYNVGGQSLQDMFSFQSSPTTYSNTGRGEQEAPTEGSATWANEDEYKKQRAAYYQGMNLNPEDTYLKSQFENPMGNGDKDIVNAFYKYDPSSNTANPAYAYNEYRPHSWVGGNRDFAITAAALMGGAALGGAGLGSIATGAGNGAAIGAATGATSAALQDQDAFKGGAKGGVTGAVTGGVAGGVSSLGSTGSGLADGALKGAAQGASASALNGGSALDAGLKGAFTGGVGSEVTDLTNNSMVGNLAGKGAGMAYDNFNPNGYTGPTPGMGNSLVSGESGGQPNGGTMPNPQAPQGMDPWSAGIGGLGALWNYKKTTGQNNDLMGSMQNMYGPNSPYAAQMRQSLARKDAASGRRTDYAGLESRLQANLADKYASVMPTLAGLSGQNRTARNGMLGSIGQINQGLGGMGGLGGLAKSGWGAMQDMWNKSGAPSGGFNPSQTPTGGLDALYGNTGYGDSNYMNYGSPADAGTSYGIDDLSWLGD